MDLKAYAKGAGVTQKAAKESFPECRECRGAGKIKVYSFNPYSEKQMKVFLYDVLGAPKTIFKKKLKSDAEALKKVLRWARG